MRVPMIAGNWKMYRTAREAAQTIRTLRGLVGEVTDVDVVVCPPFTALPAALEAASDSRIGIGAQDCHWGKEGAYTGEVAVPMLADLGCSHVIVGHSERRQFFGETDATVDRKIEAVLAHGLACIHANRSAVSRSSPVSRMRRIRYNGSLLRPRWPSVSFWTLRRTSSMARLARRMAWK